MTTNEFNHQFTKVQSFLYSFALKLTRNPADAQDLLQETASRAYEFRHRFTVGTNFKAWITTIMRNLMINNIRSSKKRKQAETPIEDMLFAVENKTVRNQAYSAIMCKELNDILHDLSQEYRIPFLMFYQGYEYQEIADHLELPMGTVKSRIFYARKKLKKMITGHYGMLQAS
jgi:RNA polymerase sigma factor (sigma-70 family)